MDFSEGSPEMHAGALYLAKFRPWLMRFLQQEGKQPLKRLLNKGSAETGASQVTLRRYLDAMVEETRPEYRVVIEGYWVMLPEQQDTGPQAPTLEVPGEAPDPLQDAPDHPGQEAAPSGLMGRVRATLAGKSGRAERIRL